MSIWISITLFIVSFNSYADTLKPKFSDGKSSWFEAKSVDYEYLFVEEDYCTKNYKSRADVDYAASRNLKLIPKGYEYEQFSPVDFKCIEGDSFKTIEVSPKLYEETVADHKINESLPPSKKLSFNQYLKKHSVIFQKDIDQRKVCKTSFFPTETDVATLGLNKSFTYSCLTKKFDYKDLCTVGLVHSSGRIHNGFKTKEQGCYSKTCPKNSVKFEYMCGICPKGTTYDETETASYWAKENFPRILCKK